MILQAPEAVSLIGSLNDDVAVHSGPDLGLALEPPVQEMKNASLSLLSNVFVSGKYEYTRRACSHPVSGIYISPSIHPATLPSKLIPLPEEALGFLSLFVQFLLTLSFLGPFHV